MKRVTIVFLAVFLVALPLVAFAGETAFTMRFNSPVNVAGTALKAGEYRIVVQDEATKPVVVFYDGRREVARAEGVWANLENPAIRNCVATRRSEQGEAFVSRILLQGNNKAVQLGEMSAAAKK